MRYLGAHEGRSAQGRRLHGWLLVTPALFAAASLGGCGLASSAHPAGKAVPHSARVEPTTMGPLTSAQAHARGMCATSASHGSCGPYRDSAITQSSGHNTYVGQDVWSPIPGWSQTLYAASPGKWFVTARMPAGNTSVVSFPNVSQQYYYTNTLADFSSIYSSFAEHMHAQGGTSAEASYDIWLNDWKNEVMIQHDIVNRATCPVSGTATFGGSGGVPVRHWNLCVNGSELIWQLSGAAEQSGRVDVLGMLTWLVRHRYLPHGTGLTAISYGFEICSTGGRPETFTVSRFTISSTPLPARAGRPAQHVIDDSRVEQLPDPAQPDVLG